MHKGINTYAFTYMHWACNKTKYGSRLHVKPDRNNVCFILQFCRTFVSKILAQWLRVVKLAFPVRIIVVYAGMGWWDKTVMKVCWSTDLSVYLLVCVLYESQVSTEIVLRQTNHNFRRAYRISYTVAGRWKKQFTDNTCETEQNKSYACVVTWSVFAWEKLILCFQV